MTLKRPNQRCGWSKFYLNLPPKLAQKLTRKFNKKKVMIDTWRWDQGRLIYFQFDTLRVIAKCFVEIENTQINIKDLDPLRIILANSTRMPFSPTDYKVWRNYKRVFECSMLGTSIENRLFVTDICKSIAQDDNFDTDKYLSNLIPRFRYPYPAFSEYNPREETVYPFCAILKYLIANFNNTTPYITLDEVFSTIIGNGCTGKESLAHYRKLSVTTRYPQGDEGRQVREMMIFMSQLSILKWNNGKLFLDATRFDLEYNDNFFALITPFEIPPNATREQDFVNLTSLESFEADSFSIQSRETVLENVFTEGKRTRVTHIKIERSPLLRKIYFENYPATVCDMCEANTRVRYPWTDNLLEIHHILPLSSPLHINSSGTSLKDVVPICPNCHRSVHSYYKNWLNGNNVNDFRDKNEAIHVYNEAKNRVVA